MRYPNFVFKQKAAAGRAAAFITLEGRSILRNHQAADMMFAIHRKIDQVNARSVGRNIELMYTGSKVGVQHFAYQSAGEVFHPQADRAILVQLELNMAGKAEVGFG